MFCFQWDSSAVVPSYYSEGKTKTKTPVSVSPTRMFPTWAMTPPQPPAPPPAVRSLEASPTVSSNASRSARPRLRANLAQPMEGPVLQITKGETERKEERDGAGTSQMSVKSYLCYILIVHNLTSFRPYCTQEASLALVFSCLGRHPSRTITAFQNGKRH